MTQLLRRTIFFLLGIVAFMEEEYAKRDEKSPWYKENGEALVFLHELEKIPYLVYPSPTSDTKSSVSASENDDDNP